MAKNRRAVFSVTQMRFRVVAGGGFSSLPPERMDPRDLFCPKFKLVIEDPSLAFSHFKKSWTWLHITRLMNYDNRGEPPAFVIVFTSDLPKEVGEAGVMSVKSDRADLGDKL